MKGGRTPGGRSEHGQRRKAALGTVAGHEARTGMMILASAMRHSVGRPATGMGGGTLNPMERLCQPPSESAFLRREQRNTEAAISAKFVGEMRLTVKRISPLKYVLWRKSVKKLVENLTFPLTFDKIKMSQGKNGDCRIGGYDEQAVK